MLLSSARIFLILAVVLTGCGFTPVYAPSGSGHALRGAVTVAAPADRESFNFARAMTAHFGETEAARYHLDYTIQTAEDQIGLTRDQEINRYHVEGTADYKLSDLASGTIVASGTVSAFTAYGASGTTIASRAANKDAYSRLITQLADKLLTDILAKLDTGE